MKSSSEATCPERSRDRLVLASSFNTKKRTDFKSNLIWGFFFCCSSLLLLLPRASFTNLSTSTALHSYASSSQHSSSSVSLRLLRQQIKHLCATSPQHPGTHKPRAAHVSPPPCKAWVYSAFQSRSCFDALSPTAVSPRAAGPCACAFSFLWHISNLALFIQQKHCIKSTHISG